MASSPMKTAPALVAQRSTVEAEERISRARQAVAFCPPGLVVARAAASPGGEVRHVRPRRPRGSPARSAAGAPRSSCRSRFRAPMPGAGAATASSATARCSCTSGTRRASSPSRPGFSTSRPSRLSLGDRGTPIVEYVTTDLEMGRHDPHGHRGSPLPGRRVRLRHRSHVLEHVPDDQRRCGRSAE